MPPGDPRDTTANRDTAAARDAAADSHAAVAAPGTRLDDRPPFFRSWKGVYAVVLGWLAFLVACFHLLTRWLH